MDHLLNLKILLGWNLECCEFCNFTPFPAVFQSYQGDGRLCAMKSPLQIKRFPSFSQNGIQTTCFGGQRLTHCAKRAPRVKGDSSEL